MGYKLNILLLSRYFPPEIGTAANLFFELAKGLSQNSHKVTVVTNFPWYNLETVPERYSGRFYMKENMSGFEVIRLKFPVFGTKKLKLILGHLTVPFTTFLGGMIAKCPDIIFVYSPPLFMGLAGWLVSLFKRVPWAMGVQDLHPQCYIDQGALKNGLLIHLLETIEKFCYQKASLITVHSKGNMEHIVYKKNADEGKVKVLSNWINTDELQPLPRDNEFARRQGLNGQFIVGYAGTLSISQGLISIIEAANILRNRDDIEFFIVGDGIEKQKMIEKVKEYDLRNVRFLGMQPKSVYPYVVASSNVGLVTLNSKVKTPVIPSKILSMMASSRPVLASVPLDGDATRLIVDAQCGICIEPENPKKLAEKIIYLSTNRRLCEKFGELGRNYVVEHFSLGKVMNDIEDMFEALLKKERGAGHE
jgi:colanic acid biosynthesis glycosyl transferase WcaI